ncbi:MAG: S-methyl-5-thioribose-1-phosphate isomerase [Alphaproteobacteria bacterium]|nr:S-methyl-5-thioribose-1-phosphate isomerase [Alphaproteobacteria bacterium]
MKIAGRAMRTIWRTADGRSVETIDQTRLPHAFVTLRLASAEDAARAIREMRVRGAPLIGATAAYGLAIALLEDPGDSGLERAYQLLVAARPTAVNLRWALDETRRAVAIASVGDRAARAFACADQICDDDVAICRAIGEHGLGLLRAAAERVGGRRLNILTHCNAGWLATVDWGTATAPIYRARQEGIDLHVWVDETRPRNQGAALTAYELCEEGVAHTVIADNTGGHLMQRGLVDLCIVGTDRTTARGDVANKIGTYLKAVAARDTGVPFYVALPSPSIDWTLTDGLAQIPIEQRDAREVTHVTGLAEDGRLYDVRITPAHSPAANYGFDVTPARLVTAFVTERGVCAASASGLAGLFPERAPGTH